MLHNSILKLNISRSNWKIERVVIFILQTKTYHDGADPFLQYERSIKLFHNLL